MEERSAVESTEWVREGCLFSARTSPSSKPSETVRSNSPPASRPPSFSLDPGSLPLSVSLSSPSLFRLFLSFSLLFSLSLSFLLPADPADVSAYPRVRRRGIMEILNQFENQ